MQGGKFVPNCVDFGTNSIVDLLWIFPINDCDYSFYLHTHGVYTQIDYIFLQYLMLANLSKSSIGNILNSDHAPIHCDLALPHNYCKLFFWRLNETLLSDALCLYIYDKTRTLWHYCAFILMPLLLYQFVMYPWWPRLLG